MSKNTKKETEKEKPQGLDPKVLRKRNWFSPETANRRSSRTRRSRDNEKGIRDRQRKNRGEAKLCKGKTQEGALSTKE